MTWEQYSHTCEACQTDFRIGGLAPRFCPACGSKMGGDSE